MPKYRLIHRPEPTKDLRALHPNNQTLGMGHYSQADMEVSHGKRPAT